MVFQGLDRQQTEAVWKPFFDWIAASPQDFAMLAAPRIGALPAQRFWDPSFLTSIPGLVIADDRQGAPVDNIFWAGNLGEAGAVWSAYQSAWLPASLLETDRRQSLADALFAAAKHQEVALHCNKGLAGAPADAIAAAKDTAMNPAVIDAFALVISAALEEPAYPGVPGHEPDAAGRTKPVRRGEPVDERNPQAPAPRRLLCVGDRLLPAKLAGGVLGRELPAAAGDQGRNTIPKASSSSITASAAKTGARTDLRGRIDVLHSPAHLNLPPNPRPPMPYTPSPTRYETMLFNRCGKSGLKLPAISLGLWHNFGFGKSAESKSAICRRAFDLGVTHFDLANNYGPPPGAAEIAFGDILRADFRGHRDELVVSTKAGYLMWPGPYGEWGGRKSMLASLDQSLKRMGLDYVDIFYSHRFDPETPLEETMGALDSAVRQGKALYVGISSYNSRRTKEAVAILTRLGTPCLIHQPSYSMINRWIEDDRLLDTLEEEGVGAIVFSPLAQGLLTDKYLNGVPEGSRATASHFFNKAMLAPTNIERARHLDAIARRRGQTLAQMALAWTLRDKRVTSALIGASSPEQVTDSVKALDNLSFTAEELKEIDRYAVEGGVNLWRQSAELGG